MTIKEISKVCGRTPQNIWQYVQRAIAPEQGVIKGIQIDIRKKMDRASAFYPADFTEDEVIYILRRSPNPVFANLITNIMKEGFKNV